MKKKKNSSDDNTVMIAIAMLIISVIAIRLLPQVCKNLEQYYYSSQIIAAVFVIVAGLAALWQYRTTSRNNHTSVNDTRVHRAINLTEYYKDNILRYYPALWYVFDKCGIKDIFTSIQLSKMVSFDEEEKRKLFTPAQLKEIKNKQSDPTFITAVIEADEIYDLGLNIDKEIHQRIKDDGTKEVKISANANKAVSAFMQDIKNTMLNNMEYFAMAFTHNTADESVVYQSLHQSYFEAIHLLYYFIASYNTSSTDKYYTNVTKLYRIWYVRSRDQEKKRKLLANSNIHSGTIVD